MPAGQFSRLSYMGGLHFRFYLLHTQCPIHGGHQ
jgi:hypothetical protein